MSGAAVVYLIYVAMAVAVISWLGVTLHRTGRVFLDDVFATNRDMSAAVGRLLVTGFMVFTLGYALLLLRIDAAASTAEALQASLRQFGLLLLSLGLLHSLNMAVLFQVRRRYRQEATARDARRIGQRRRG